MHLRSCLAAMAVTTTLFGTPATAADLFGFVCAPPPAYTVSIAPTGFFHWYYNRDQPRLLYVERYDPHNPPPAPTPTYVIPQTAYLASTICDYTGAEPRSWYDGKLWYRPGGVRSSPDTFMIIERD
jgi:hypothetical protein